MSCKGLGEVTEATKEVGVRMTTNKAAEVRKRKFDGEELSSCSSSLVQLKRRLSIAITGEKSDDPCASPSFNHQALSSCSSSNASSNLAEEKFTAVDLQEEDEEASSVEITTSTTYNMERRERREATPSSELESKTVRPSEACSRRRSTTTVKMPSDAEIERFFSAAEKDLQKHFSEKYNFDFAEEQALEGRFVWTRVKP